MEILSYIEAAFYLIGCVFFVTCIGLGFKLIWVYAEQSNALIREIRLTQPLRPR